MCKDLDYYRTGLRFETRTFSLLGQIDKNYCGCFRCQLTRVPTIFQGINRGDCCGQLRQDSELTGLPGEQSVVGNHGSDRGRCFSLGVEGDGGASPGGAWGLASGYKKPEELGALACGTASARPCGVSQRGALG